VRGMSVGAGTYTSFTPDSFVAFSDGFDAEDSLDIPADAFDSADSFDTTELLLGYAASKGTTAASEGRAGNSSDAQDQLHQ
jgi:hypothetical protein